MKRVLAVAGASALLAVGCTALSGPDVSDVRIGRPTGPNTALYLTARSDSASDRLIGATTDVAASIEIHETATSDEGTVGMRSVEGLDLAAEGTLILEPGSYHVMLVDVERLDAGESVEVMLIWENAGEMTVRATVVEPSETLSDQ